MIWHNKPDELLFCLRDNIPRFNTVEIWIARAMVCNVRQFHEVRFQLGD